MIALCDVHKRYGDRAILAGFDARIGAGEVVAVVGPSGIGKSTLLRCINGLEPFDAGEIRVAGETLHPGDGRANPPDTLRRVRERVGFVFQQWHLFAHRSVLANVLEGPVHVRKQGRTEATALADRLLAQVGLSHRRDAAPHQLSGGEQQRVAIARALAMRPAALLLDEPTSALDPARVDALAELLRGLSAGGLTLVVVTHERRFARSIASRVLLLDHGRVSADGPPETVLSE